MKAQKGDRIRILKRKIETEIKASF